MPHRAAIRKALTAPDTFSRLVPARRLRKYQARAARSIADGITKPTKDGLLVMLFSRQAGKDELIAQMLTYLLLRHSRVGGSIVVVTPTGTPQAKISFDRTLAYAQTHPFTRHSVRQSGGYEIHIGKAKATFLGQHGNARGQTASIALIANEAQDIEPDRWDSVFDPMAASTNAPTLFSGTIWTPDTLLSRQLRYARDLEEEDRRQRVHRVEWREVAKELPAYGDRVRSRIAQLGATHPFIRTEYDLIELDSSATMFNEQRLAMLEGAHPRQRQPVDRRQRVAFLVDVAGADEAIDSGVQDPDTHRDSTVLTIVAFEQWDALTHYRVLDRITWHNIPWATVDGAITSLIERWNPAITIVDATGIGHGMWQRLAARHPTHRIDAFTFTARSKSDIGWRTLGIIDSGRVHEYAQDDEPDTAEHWWQLRHLTANVRSGETRLLSYGIPASSGHDDSVLSFMLIGYLDEQDLAPRIARGS